MIRPWNSKVIARRIKSDGGHRLYVQNKVDEIGYAAARDGRFRLDLTGMAAAMTAAGRK
jgi:hypothetical protein